MKLTMRTCRHFQSQTPSAGTCPARRVRSASQVRSGFKYIKGVCNTYLVFAFVHAHKGYRHIDKGFRVYRPSNPKVRHCVVGSTGKGRCRHLPGFRVLGFDGKLAFGQRSLEVGTCLHSGGRVSSCMKNRRRWQL